MESPKHELEVAGAPESSAASTSSTVYKGDVLVLDWEDQKAEIYPGKRAKVWYDEGDKIRVEMACGCLGWIEKDRKKKPFTCVPGAGTGMDWRYGKGPLEPDYEVRAKAERRVAALEERITERRISNDRGEVGVTIPGGIVNDKRRSTMAKSKRERAMEVAGIASPDQMAAGTPVVPTQDGMLPIMGYSDKVKTYTTNASFYKKLGEEISEGKAFFRQLAKAMLTKAVGAVTRIEFLADDGTRLPVQLPDPAKASSRTQLKDEDIVNAANLKLDVQALGLVETEQSYVLTGDFVIWLDNLLEQNYVSQGQPIPKGVTKKTCLKLSQEGVTKLQEMRTGATDENLRSAATLLLEVGLREPTVG